MTHDPARVRRRARARRTPDEDPMPATYDPEIPFFYDLRRSLVAHAERDVRAQQRTERWRRLWQLPLPVERVARRTFVLSGLLVVLAASAWGASSIVSSSQPSHPLATTRTLLIHHGAAGSEGWTLRIWSRGGRLCEELLVADEENSSCAAGPGADAVQALRVASPQRVYVFGVTGTGVRRVRVRFGTASTVVSTRRTAGSGGHSRWFVAVRRRPRGTALPATTVRPLTDNQQ